MTTIPHSEQALIADEREQVEAFLHDNRAEVMALLDGISDEQARQRLVTSSTTLLGLVKHATFVERVWFDVALVGHTRTELGLPETVEESFALDDGDTVESVRSDYLAAWADSDAIAAAHTLDGLALHNRRGPLSLRWIYLHMIEELARHAGHGDILREQLLHPTGRQL